MSKYKGQLEAMWKFMTEKDWIMIFLYEDEKLQITKETHLFHIYDDCIMYRSKGSTITSLIPFHNIKEISFVNNSEDESLKCL
ncbi:hypothetical protein [Methanobrevibacter sp. DSM 116169]|uniref:hypothetical protein n=1 Tax=Methanobrevibacter sp. DSM 116169 TaxID=3242727 RepID=UPI0038FD144D